LISRKCCREPILTKLVSATISQLFGSSAKESRQSIQITSQEKLPLFPTNFDPLPFSVFCRHPPPELTNRASAGLTNPRPSSDGSWKEVIDNPSFFSPSLELGDPCTYTDMSRPFFKSTVARRLSQQHGRLFSTTRCALRLSTSSVGQPATRRLTTASVGAPAYRPSLRGCLSRSPASQFVASFSSSSARLATKVTQNPRTGDDGEPLMIGISPRAVTVRVQ
jgi:hypothetical protein